MPGTRLAIGDEAAWLHRFKFRQPVRVQFYETDANGHVNDASYFLYMAQLRNGYFAHLGLAAEMTTPGAGRTCVSALWGCEYRSAVKFGDSIEGRARVARLGRSSLEFEYALVKAEAGVLAAVGWNTWVHYDLHAGKPRPIPDAARAAILAFEGLAP